MTKIKEDLKLIDYLNEKDISYDDLKLMIEKSIDTALEESEGEEEPQQDEPHEEDDTQEEEVPTFTKEDIKDLISEEVKRTLKIKRKVPSKGKPIKPEDDPTMKKDVIKKNWFEVMV